MNSNKMTCSEYLREILTSESITKIEECLTDLKYLTIDEKNQLNFTDKEFVFTYGLHIAVGKVKQANEIISDECEEGVICSMLYHLFDDRVKILKTDIERKSDMIGGKKNVKNN